MSALLRFSLLGIFGAAGLAVAIGLATTLDTRSPESRADGPFANARPGAAGRANADNQPRPAPTQGRVAKLKQPFRDPFDSLNSAMAIDRQNREALLRYGQQAAELLSAQAGGPSLTEPTQNPAAPSRAAGLAEATPGALPPPAKTGPPPVVEGEGDSSLNINVQDTDIRQVIDLISRQGGLNILASKSVQGRVSASLVNVSLDTALDAILRSTGFVARRDGAFIFVGTPADFDEMDQRADRIITRVYRPNYATARELQALITPMLTPNVGTASVNSASEVGIGSDTNAVGGDAYAGMEVLLVRDYALVLSQIDQVVDEVDRRPAQVMIEAMIVSVKLDDTNRIGVDFELLRDNDNLRIISGNPIGNLAALDFSDGGLNIGFLDSSLAIFLEALETVGDVNVIASPRLMCLNKQRAEIHIGREVGYVSTTIVENTATQSVEFLEVGTQLRLRPFIASDGLIRMEVHPELSTGQVDLRGGFTVPDKDVTQVTTNVMAPDGSTFVIGGLIRESIDKSKTQIPLLGSLPIIGPLFRQKEEEYDREEVIILITPRIVYDQEASCDGERAECESLQRQTVVLDKTSPLGSRYIARRYYRMAESSYAFGDAQSALKYANLAIHFDRNHQDAMNLRAQIVATTPYGDATIDCHLREGLAPWSRPHTGPLPPPWTLGPPPPEPGLPPPPPEPDLPPPAPLTPPPPRPLDRGAPTVQRDLPKLPAPTP